MISPIFFFSHNPKRSAFFLQHNPPDFILGGAAATHGFFGMKLVEAVSFSW